MRPEDAKKLLGGYATGTLTEAEQDALFAAALDDQELFDALAREQSLREVLGDPAVKAELLAVLDERPRRWWNWRPAAVLALAGIAALALVIVRPKAPPLATIAEVKAPLASAPSPPPVIAEQGIEPRPASPSAKRAASPRRVSAETVQEGKIIAVPQEKPSFERQRAPSAVAGAVAPAPPAPAPMSLLPRDTAAPMQIQAEPQLRASSGAPSPRDQFYDATAAGLRLQAVSEMAARRPLGLRYTVLRKEGTEFVAADAETLTPEDTVALRFTANVNGFLSIDGATPVAITPMQPYTTGPIGATEVKVVFSRTPETSAEGSVVTERRDREIFVVNTPPSTAVAFTITLKRN